MVAVLIPSALRGESGGHARLEVAAAGTLRAVLDEVAIRWPRLERRLRDETGELRRYINIYVDGEDVRQLAGQATALPAHGEVRIIPSVAGG
jgi:molybdopterin converting factor small subunit